MKKNNSKLSALILAIVLVIISMSWIVLNGRKYKAKVDIRNGASNINDLDITVFQDKEIVKNTNQNLENGVLKLDFESVSKGKASVEIKGKNDYYNYFLLYVHPLGVITYNSYLGDCTGVRIIPISILIFMVYIVFLLIKAYKESLKKSIYQYKNIVYLGIIIFLTISCFNFIFSVINFHGIIDALQAIRGACSTFSIVLLPIFFVVSFLVTITNIVLIKKEGFSWKNMLGFILGVLLCFITIFPEIVNNMLQNSTWIDVHKENGLAVYVQRFIETSIYIIISYLESILLATIVLGIKSAKRIPKFDKDFILILGCKIKKDGTLTNLLKGRADKAIEFRNMQKEKTGKDLIFIPSGGQGSDEIISEAQAVKNYLIEKGIDEHHILVEDKSKNTFENIKFSNKLIQENKQDAKIAFSTTGYHVFRAGIIANNQNINAEGIGSKTKFYFGINAFIREFVATLFSEKKKHIGIIVMINIAAILMIATEYLEVVLL